MSPGAISLLTVSVSTRGSHTYRVEQTLLRGPTGGGGWGGCGGGKRHHALPTKTYWAVKSPEDQTQLARRAALEISIYPRVWESQGSGRLSRATPLTHGQQWLGQKHVSEQLIRPLFLLPPPDIYAWADTRQWELKNWGLEGTVDNTGHLAEMRRHSNTCLSC